MPLIACDRLILKGERRKYYPGFKECCRIRSDKSGIIPIFSIRSLRYCQNDTPNLRQVFFKLVKVSRQRRPDSLRVLPLILRFLTYSRIAFSAPLLCKGIPPVGRSFNHFHTFLCKLCPEKNELYPKKLLLSSISSNIIPVRSIPYTGQI